MDVDSWRALLRAVARSRGVEHTRVNGCWHGFSAMKAIDPLTLDIASR